MKRILAVFLVLCMVSSFGVLVFADDNDDDKLTLDIIIPRYSDNTEDWFLRGRTGMNETNFTEMFEEKNPEIKLNIEVVDWSNIYSVVDSRIASGQVPDVLCSDIFVDYVNKDLLEPASQWCPGELFNDDLFPAYIDNSVIDDVCWAIPDLATIRVLCYNADIFDEAGVYPPTTWGEIEEVCQAIYDFYDGEVCPLGIDMTADEGQAAFSYFIWNNAGDYLDADDNWILNCAENVEAVGYAVGLVNKGYTNPNPESQARDELKDMFAAGKIAMLIESNQMPAFLEEAESDVNLGVAPIPANEGKDSITFAIMHRMMAFKDEECENQDARDAAIRSFVSSFYAIEDYNDWVSMEGLLPVRDMAAKALAASNPDLQVWISYLDASKLYPLRKVEWDEVKKGIVDAEQSVLAGASVQNTLDELQAKFAD